MMPPCETCDARHEPTPPNPLPCGCGVKAIVTPDALGNRMESHHVHVVHCPMHAAAERMADLLESLVLTEYQSGPPTLPRTALAAYGSVAEKARAILHEIGRL